MLVYRITKAAYASDLSGEGARRFGGRWNRKGVPMIYTAESPSLALLEVLVHLPLSTLPKNYQLVTITIQDEIYIETIEAHSLPADWKRVPAPDSLAEIGSDWAIGLSSVALRVPSAVITGQKNILLNPRHAEFEYVTIVQTETFEFDSRLRNESK